MNQIRDGRPNIFSRYFQILCKCERQKKLGGVRGERKIRDCPESSEVECEKSETKTDATEMTGVK